MSKKSTIYDVAKQCGASPATVSRVINQPSLVSDATRKKVYEAMQQLNFTAKDTSAQSKLCFAGGMIIVNLPHLDNPFYGEVVRGVEAAAKRYSCTILVLSETITAETLNKTKALLKGLKPIGIITTTVTDPKLLSALDAIIPVVQCCEVNTNVNISSVSIDDVLAAFTAVDYLCSLRRTRIAMVNGPIEYKCDQDRLEGYKKALVAHSLPVHENLITCLPDVNYGIAVSAVSQMLSSPDSIIPDAIFASSDVYALAAIRAINLCGLRIPEDISVIGFDNIDVSSIYVPALTTINQPRLQLGFSACELLFERITHPEFPAKHLTLEAEMILRESTAYKEP